MNGTECETEKEREREREEIQGQARENEKSGKERTGSRKCLLLLSNGMS